MNKNELSKYFEQNMEKFLKFLGENVTIVKRNIGEGAFSVVHMIEEKIGSKMIQSALKVELIAEEGHTDSQKQTFIENQKKRVEKEAAIMQQLNECPNIVKYYSHIIRPVILNDKIEGYVCLLKMELLNPFSEAAKNISFTEQDVLKIALDIGKGIQAAHEKRIIHRDIKPENFFVSDTGDYKLGDFNVSKEAATAHTFAGAYGYIAPEIYRAKTEIDKKYTCQADLYSFGICLYQFMNDMYFPFEDAECDADSALDIRMNGTKLPAPKHGSDDLKKIILKACEFETADRYQTIDDLLINLEQLIRHEEVIIPEAAPKIKHVPIEYANEIPITDNIYRPIRQPDARVSSQTLIMIACVLAVFLCIAVLFVFMLKDNKDSETQSILESETAAETAPPSGNDTSEEYTYQAVCPVCSNTISISSERFKTGRIFCPNCGQELMFANNEEQNNSYHAESPVNQPSEITMLSSETSISEASPQTLSPETAPPQTTPPETLPPETVPPVIEEYVDMIPSFSLASCSSTLNPIHSDGKTYTYDAYRAIDDDYSTCWCEGVSGSGSGESITLYAERKQRLNEIIIYNGLCQSEELFYKNCRIKECRIEFSNGTYTDVVLNGDYTEQPSVISLDNVDTEYLKITILSTYSGNKYEDTCVSEIQVRNNS